MITDKARQTTRDIVRARFGIIISDFDRCQYGLVVDDNIGAFDGDAVAGIRLHAVDRFRDARFVTRMRVRRNNARDAVLETGAVFFQ